MSCKDKVLTIKTESGLVVQTPQKGDMEVGDPVYISYDFTHNKVVKIWLNTGKSDVDELDVSEPEELDVTGEDDDSDKQVSVAGSGALSPDSGGSEFWGLDSGILELSEPCSEDDRGDGPQ